MTPILTSVDDAITVTRFERGVMIQGLTNGVGCVITLKPDMTVSVRRIEPKAPSDLLTITEAADRLGVTPGRVRQLVRAGRIHDFVEGELHVIHVDELARFMALPKLRPGRKPCHSDSGSFSLTKPALSSGTRPSKSSVGAE